MEFNFQENAEVEDISKVPEQFRSMYEEGETGHKLAEPFSPIASAIDGLNKSLKAARKDAEKARKDRPDVTPFNELATSVLGLEEADPSAMRSAIEELMEKAAKGDKEGKVNWDKMKADLEKGYQKQLEGKDGELRAMQSSLESYLIGSEAHRAIASEKGVPELLLPHIERQTRVVKEGDKYVTRVVDEQGDPRGNHEGGFMSIGDLVKEMKASAVFGRAFESEAPAGSGTRPGGPSTRTQSRNEMTPVDRISAGLKKRGISR